MTIQDSLGTTDVDYYTENEFAYDSLPSSELPPKTSTPDKVLYIFNFP